MRYNKTKRHGYLMMIINCNDKNNNYNNNSNDNNNENKI